MPRLADTSLILARHRSWQARAVSVPQPPRRRRLPVAALVRSCHPEPTLAVTVVTAALAASAGRSVAGVAATASAVLVGQLSVGWSNDAIDAERDAATGRLDKPIAAGEIAAGTVGRAAATALVLCVPLSLLSGWRAALVHLVAVLLAWGYNLRWKSSPGSVVPYTIAFALLPTFVTLGLPGSPVPPWWAVLAGALTGAGAHFANVLPDLDDDAATGIRGLPHRLGAVTSRRLAAILLVLASAVLVLGPGRLGSPGRPATATSSGLVLGVVAALVVAGILAARRVGSRIAFRMTLLVAMIDVLLLLARGGALT
jgi:4-hydroxybenzoate polyprenyltransferase